MSDKHKTLAECKDEMEKLLSVCHDLINRFNGTSNGEPVELYMDLVDAVDQFNNVDLEAAELYAREENRKKDQPKQSDVEKSSCGLNNKIVNILEYFERGLSDVAAGSGEDQPMLSEIKEALTLLKSSPVSLEVEEFLSKETGATLEEIQDSEPLYFHQGEVIELLKKWRFQQPVSIAWLSDKEISTFALNCSGISEMNAFENGMRTAQSELRKRVDAVDWNDFDIWIKKNAYLSDGCWYLHDSMSGEIYSLKELLQIYLTSK